MPSEPVVGPREAVSSSVVGKIGGHSQDDKSLIEGRGKANRARREDGVRRLALKVGRSGSHERFGMIRPDNAPFRSLRRWTEGCACRRMGLCSGYRGQQAGGVVMGSP